MTTNSKELFSVGIGVSIKTPPGMSDGKNLSMGDCTIQSFQNIAIQRPLAITFPFTEILSCDNLKIGIDALVVGASISKKTEGQIKLQVGDGSGLSATTKIAATVKGVAFRVPGSAEASLDDALR